MSRRYPTQRHRGHREKTLIITDAGRVLPAEITGPDTGSPVRSGLSGPEAGHECVRLFLRVLCVSAALKSEPPLNPL